MFEGKQPACMFGREHFKRQICIEKYRFYYANKQAKITISNVRKIFQYNGIEVFNFLIFILFMVQDIH